MAKLLQEFVPVLAERRVWLRSVAKHYPKLVLRPGMTTHFYVAPSRSSPKGQPKQGSLKAIEVELDEDHLLTWEKGPKGIVFGKRERPYDIEIKSVAGTVEGQLSDEGQRLGLSQSLITQLVDVFSWEADFDRVQPGDSFRILYQEKVRKGASTKTKAHILAAELVNAGRQMFAIYFEGRQGTSGYYDLQGRSLARAFLRFPLEFTTISSHFSHARFHPILKIERPHNGVDFVARAGTPVRAVADGKVRFAGWKRGGYGRLITIEHNDGYATRYAHLLKYAAGIKAGVEVKRGQVIGYVGSSGRSTGPHLHFEIYKDGQYMDPLGYESPPEQLLESSLLKIFDNAKQAFLAELASAPHS
jgi:murein DD-endopeptidase MepM/ murein hydrolase activator NlpD